MAQGEKRPVVMEAAKGVPGGVASLGADGKVPQEQLPEFGISNAEIKQKLVDDDCLAITDSEANNRTKRVFWSNIKEILGGLFVPVTRKINNKALSSDVTLTGADINVSGTDSTSISTALSNKVNGGFTLYRDPSLDLDMDLSTITMDTLFATMPSNTIMVAGLDSGWNKDIAPAATGTLIAVSRYQGRKFAIFNTAGLSDLWIGSMGSSFSGWKPFAMAEPPQEYTLPLTDYVTELYGCRYSRDQFGRVVCYGTMEPTREISTGITIATLPAGYRPTNTLRVAGIVVDQSGFASAIGIGVAATGEISVRGDTVPSTAQYVSFSVAFQGA